MTMLPNLNDHHLGSRLEEADFNCCVDHAAAFLVGTYLFCDTDSVRLGGIILETEAYCQRDPAAHCYSDLRTKEQPDHPKGPRMHDAMYLPAGYIYIYPNSKYCCFNIVCGAKYFGAGVLVRSILPFEDCAGAMIRRRNPIHPEKITRKRISSGPMMLCEALNIGHKFNGKALGETNVRLYRPASETKLDIVSGRRIGIPERHSEAKNWRRRYVLTGMSNGYRVPNGYHKPVINPIGHALKPHDGSECSCFTELSNS